MSTEYYLANRVKRKCNSSKGTKTIDYRKEYSANKRKEEEATYAA